MKQTSEKPLRVCFIYYNSFIQLLHREAMTLRKAGIQVDIICLKNLRNEKFFEKYDGINLFKIQSRMNAENTVFGYVAKLLLFLINATVLMSILGLTRRYSVVHVTSPPDIAVFTTIVPKLLGARVILDIHDIGPELFMRKLHVGEGNVIIRMLKFLEKLSSTYADHVITVTHLWRDKLVGRSVPKEKCSVLLNVPDQEVFRFNQKKGAAGETFNLYYHGSIEEHFGVDTMLEAMTQVVPVIDNVRLHIYAGKKGRMYDYLTDYIQSNGLEEHVMFYEGVPFHELPGILADADLGMVPTKNSTFADEAVSMKSFEYVFLGIPIIITRTKAHSYYYDDSMVRFFDPCNSRDLADAVIELYRDPEKMRRMVANSRGFMNRHSWQNGGDTYRKIVMDLVQDGSYAARHDAETL